MSQTEVAPMSLREYVESRKAELDSFGEMWELNRNSPNPGDEWPMSLYEAEWFGQELAYLETRGKELP